MFRLIRPPEIGHEEVRVEWLNEPRDDHEKET